MADSNRIYLIDEGLLREFAVTMELTVFPKCKWGPSSPMWPKGILFPVMTPDGNQLWYSREANAVDKLNRQNWRRAGYSAKTFEKHRNEEAAA